jgi:hypothetical protein
MVDKHVYTIGQVEKDKLTPSTNMLTRSAKWVSITNYDIIWFD